MFYNNYQEQNTDSKILTYTHITAGKTQYEEGWKDFYFKPMKEYFG